MLVTLRVKGCTIKLSLLFGGLFSPQTSASISSAIFKPCDTYSTIFLLFSMLAGDARINVLYVKEEPL